MRKVAQRTNDSALVEEIERNRELRELSQYTYCLWALQDERAVSYDVMHLFLFLCPLCELMDC